MRKWWNRKKGNGITAKNANNLSIEMGKNVFAWIGPIYAINRHTKCNNNILRAILISCQ